MHAHTHDASVSPASCTNCANSPKHSRELHQLRKSARSHLDEKVSAALCDLLVERQDQL